MKKFAIEIKSQPKLEAAKPQPQLLPFIETFYQNLEAIQNLISCQHKTLPDSEQDPESEEDQSVDEGQLGLEIKG